MYNKFISIFTILLCVGCAAKPVELSKPVFCKQGPLFCYSTIGSPNCYTSPQAGQENRLIASEENAVYDPSLLCEKPKY